MSTGEQLIKARLEMLGLAVELQSVTLACRRAGVSRSHFYGIKQASYLKISHELTMRGVSALPSAVRYVWRRHGLTVRHQRLHWVERRRAEHGGMLTEPQMELPRPCQGSQSDLKQQAEVPLPATMPANAKTTQAVSKAAWAMSRLRTLPAEHFYRAVLSLAWGQKATSVAKWLLDQPELGGLQGGGELAWRSMRQAWRREQSALLCAAHASSRAETAAVAALAEVGGRRGFGSAVRVVAARAARPVERLREFACRRRSGF